MLHSVFIESDKWGDYISKLNRQGRNASQRRTCALCFQGLRIDLHAVQTIKSFEAVYFHYINKNNNELTSTMEYTQPH